MKKSFMFLMASLLMYSGIAFAGYAEPSYSANKINNKADNQKEAYREIMLVRFGEDGVNGASIASGDAVVWSTVSDDGVTVAFTTTSADQAFAGIACTAIQTADSVDATVYSDDAGRRNWGYIVVYGKADANVTAGGQSGATVGTSFITSTDSGKITGMQTGTTTAIEPAIRQAAARGGFFFDTASAAATVVEVFVKAE